MKDKETQRSKGCGVVEYSTPAEALDAIQMYNGQTVSVPSALMKSICVVNGVHAYMLALC